MPRRRTTRTTDEATGPLCPCRQLDELCERHHGRELGNDVIVTLAALRKKVWTPCWACGASMGCSTCKPRPGWDSLEARCAAAVCPYCGVFTTGVAFLLGAQRLPPQDFQLYPAGWRLEFFAVYGAPQKMLPAVRVHLRSEEAFVRINRVLRHLGKTEYTVDPVTGNVQWVE